MDEKKKIEVVTGNGKDLDISPVYQHLEVEKPKEEKKEHIVIPEEKNRKLKLYKNITLYNFFL